MNNILQLNKIYNEDCIGDKGMCLIPDKSIDMILCDLPFGTTKCKWDSIIPFDKLWNQYNRIIKDNGVVALFAQTPFDKALGVSNLDMLKYEWIWEKSKPTGHLNANYAPMKKHENILIFTKSPTSYTKENKDTRYYVDFMLTPINKVVKRKFKDDCVYDKNSNKNTVQKFQGYPTDILKFNGVQKPIHPTQKPTELLEFFIKLYTKANETVLDNCLGSGSTAIAAINTNRNFLGFENDSTYYELAKDRVINHIVAGFKS